MSQCPQPLVSAIIPTYNRADLIERAINSVISQSYQNWEAIVVDDCSQDNTAELVKAIADRDSRVCYYCHASNLGGSAARNTGIKQAKGEYIAFLDSDDVWLPQKLELQLEAIAQLGFSDRSVASYTKFQKSSRVFYQTSILPRRGKHDGETIADYFWLGQGEVLTSTLLVSRTLALEHLFREGLPKHQDLDFVLRLGYTAAEFVFLPEVLTIWHNESRSDRVSRLTDYQISLDWIASYKERISDRAYRGFVLKEVVPSMLLQEKDKATAVNLLKEGFRQGIIPLDYFLFLSVKQGMPNNFLQFLKRLMQRTKLIDNS